jgi:hypothetical protein
MEPFRISKPILKLVDPYPDPKILLDIAHSGGEQAQVAFARLWLSEGIPYAFRNCPAIYESVRTWLSTRLNVHAKEISLVGSARLGRSIAPENLGNPFDETSDLDIFIVSGRLFEALREDFCSWSFDFEEGRITANNCREAKFWRNNNDQVPKNIQRGFIDTKKIPNRFEYSTVQKVNDTMSLLVSKLKITSKAPKPKQASVRCYSSWDAFVQQTLLNLRTCAESSRTP